MSEENEHDVCSTTMKALVSLCALHMWVQCFAGQLSRRNRQQTAGDVTV